MKRKNLSNSIPSENFIGSYVGLNMKDFLEYNSWAQSEMFQGLYPDNYFQIGKIVSITANGEKYGVEFENEIWDDDFVANECSIYATHNLHGKGRDACCLYVNPALLIPKDGARRIEREFDNLCPIPAVEGELEDFGIASDDDFIAII